MKTNTIFVAVIGALALVTTGAIVVKAIGEKTISQNTETLVSPTGVMETAATAGPSPTAEKKSDRCVIMISGSKYDVTDLISKHPGGDVFSDKCGTDMTSIFNKQHKGNLDMIKDFKVE